LGWEVHAAQQTVKAGIGTHAVKARLDEIIQVLKLGLVQGMQASTLGVSVLAEELERNAASQRGSA